jgi:membrane dipeptidase
MEVGQETRVTEPAAADYLRVHAEAIVIDAVCPLLADPRYIPWWVEGGATAAAPTVGAFEGPRETLKSVARWVRLTASDPTLVLVKRAADIEAAKRENKFGIILHFQNTIMYEDDLDLIDAFKALGVGMAQLTYNVKNRVGDGCEERTDCGLSYFGMRLIERCNQARVIVDCSHTGYRTTLEAIEHSSAPVVFSHANAKALRPSGRTITDEQIKAVAATGGLVGSVGFPAFVSRQPRPTLDEFIDHIAYIADLVGIDHTGLGIDYFTGQAGVVEQEEAERSYRRAVDAGIWDPDNYPPPPYYYPSGIETPRTLPNLTKRLLERGFSVEDTKKVLGGNWLRVFRSVWGE